MYVLLVVFSYLLVYYLGWMGWDTYLQFGMGDWWAGTRTYSLERVTGGLGHVPTVWDR